MLKGLNPDKSKSLLQNFFDCTCVEIMVKIFLRYWECLESGLLNDKPGFESQARHQNEIRKVVLRRFPLSRFLAKTLRVNKIAMKSFSEKNLSFGVDFKL